MTETIEVKGVELFHEDGKPAGVWYCSKCRVVHKTQAFADSCCGERLCGCGKPIEIHRKYSSDCQQCDSRKWREKMAKREAERFEKATKVKASEWSGDQVFVEPDHYYESVEDAIEGQYGETLEYVWAAHNVGLRKADTEDIIERILEEAWEDASVDDLYGVSELQAAIDAFNKENEKVVCWMPDYSTAILIDERQP